MLDQIEYVDDFDEAPLIIDEEVVGNHDNNAKKTLTSQEHLDEPLNKDNVGASVTCCTDTQPKVTTGSGDSGSDVRGCRSNVPSSGGNCPTRDEGKNSTPVSLDPNVKFFIKTSTGEIKFVNDKVFHVQNNPKGSPSVKKTPAVTSEKKLKAVLINYRLNGNRPSNSQTGIGAVSERVVVPSVLNKGGCVPPGGACPRNITSKPSLLQVSNNNNVKSRSLIDPKTIAFLKSSMHSLPINSTNANTTSEVINNINSTSNRSIPNDNSKLEDSSNSMVVLPGSRTVGVSLNNLNLQTCRDNVTEGSLSPNKDKLTSMKKVTNVVQKSKMVHKIGHVLAQKSPENKASQNMCSLLPVNLKDIRQSINVSDHTVCRHTLNDIPISTVDSDPSCSGNTNESVGEVNQFSHTSKIQDLSKASAVNKAVILKENYNNSMTLNSFVNQSNHLDKSSCNKQTAMARSNVQIIFDSPSKTLAPHVLRIDKNVTNSHSTTSLDLVRDKGSETDDDDSDVESSEDLGFEGVDSYIQPEIGNLDPVVESCSSRPMIQEKESEKTVYDSVAVNSSKKRIGSYTFKILDKNKFKIQRRTEVKNMNISVDADNVHVLNDKKRKISETQNFNGDCVKDVPNGNEKVPDVRDKGSEVIDLDDEVERIEIKEEIMDDDDVMATDVYNDIDAPELKAFVCQGCWSVFENAHSLEMHNCPKKDDENTASLIEQRQFCCGHCGKLFADRFLMERHLKSHRGVKEFSCDLCGKEFLLKHHLVIHISDHLSIRPYHCQVCGDSFKRPTHLLKHRRQHTSNRRKEFTCEKCDKCFFDSDKLLRHRLLVHDANYEGYTCDICGSSYSTQGILSIHIRNVHQHEKANSLKRRTGFECQFCGWKYHVARQFKYHLESHDVYIDSISDLPRMIRRDVSISNDQKRKFKGIVKSCAVRIKRLNETRLSRAGHALKPKTKE